MEQELHPTKPALQLTDARNGTRGVESVRLHCIARLALRDREYQTVVAL
jgi:hypothetical protein